MTTTLKILEKSECGRIQGLSKFFKYPALLSQERTGKAVDFKFSRYIHSLVHPDKSPLKIFGEKGAWAYPWISQIFWVPPIISGMGKAANFKFCMHIHRIDQNKSPLKILRKVAVGVLRDPQKFLRHSYI